MNLLSEGVRDLKELFRDDSNEFDTLHLDTELYSELQAALPDGPLLQIRPKKDCEGLEAAQEFAESFYTDPRELPDGKTPPRHTFEIWFDESKVQFFYRPESVEWKNTFVRQVRDKYPGTRVDERDKLFPDFVPGDFICGSEFKKASETVRPLKMVDQTQSGGHSFQRDPYGGVTSNMVVQEDYLDSGERVNSDESRTILQVVFEPVTRAWSKGNSIYWNDVEDFADTLKKPELKGGALTQFTREFTGQGIEEREPSRKIRNAADAISKLRGQPGYYIRIRLLTISPYKKYAQRSARHISEAISDAYRNNITEQRLLMDPKQGSDLEDLLFETAKRDLDIGIMDKLSRVTNVMSAAELGGLVHVPNEEIETPNVDWTRKEPGAGVPADAAQMEDVLEEADESEEEDSREHIFDPVNPEVGGATVSEREKYEQQQNQREATVDGGTPTEEVPDTAGNSQSPDTDTDPLFGDGNSGAESGSQSPESDIDPLFGDDEFKQEPDPTQPSVDTSCDECGNEELTYSETFDKWGCPECSWLPTGERQADLAAALDTDDTPTEQDSGDETGLDDPL